MWFLKTLAALCLLTALVFAGFQAMLFIDTVTIDVEKADLAVKMVSEELQRVREAKLEHQGCETQFTRWVEWDSTYKEAIRFLELASAYSTERRIEKALDLATKLDAATQTVGYACS